jgi:hypothetical protein
MEELKHKSEFKEWVILELMGHRKLAGLLTEQQIGGASFIRLDIPSRDKSWTTQFYSPAAVYCITPCTELLAASMAKIYQPEPVHRYDLLELEVPGIEQESHG